MRGARLHRAATRAARRPRETCACSSLQQAGSAISSALAPSASTVEKLTAVATSWVASQAGQGVRQRGGPRRLAFPWARHWQSSRARPSSTRSTRVGATGEPLPLHLARLHSLNISVARRLCDPTGMGPEDRSQPLNGAVIEYIIHGYFYIGATVTPTAPTERGGCRFGGWLGSWARIMWRSSWRSLSRKWQG